MKFLLRLFKIFAGLLLVTILGLIGVFVFFKNIDLAPYDSLIKGQVEAKTGRLLRIDGQTKLDLSLSPALVMTDIGLANASWGQNPELISVGRLYGKLRLLPLLMGKFEVETLALEKVQIHLEQTPEGVRNYHIKSPKNPIYLNPIYLNTPYRMMGRMLPLKLSTRKFRNPPPCYRKRHLFTAFIDEIGNVAGCHYQLSRWSGSTNIRCEN